MTNDNPILNSPYVEPKLHYDTDSEGSLDYNIVCKGRRIFKTDSAVIPTRQKGQKELFEWNEDAEEYGTHPINLARKEVGKWRLEKYPNTTRVTKELLNFWFNNPERIVTKKLFFAQQESVETAIWLNEFIARVKGKDGNVKNLMIEISGMSKDKAEKKWFVENRWLPAVNSLKEKYEYPEWHFIEIANDIRNIKNQLIEKIGSL